MRKFQTLFFVLLTACFLASSACGTGKNSGETEDSNDWIGDNMEDFIAQGLEVSDQGAGIYQRTPYEERLVGVAYTTWHRNSLWNADEFWARPSIGEYRSDDAEAITEHGKLLGDVDVDFVFVDWSNNVTFNEEEYPRATYENIMNERNLGITGREDFAMIERATVKMFDIWGAMEEKTPQIAIMIGCPDKPSAIEDGSLQIKADQVYEWFIENEEYPQRAEKYMQFDGKPLLMVYLGTPTFISDRNPLEVWNDERFTVRYVTGYITEQSSLRDSETLESIYGYWSWEDRGAQTFAVNPGTKQPEAMTIVASYRAQGEPGDANYIPASGRQNGRIFREEWARARLIGVKTALVVSWNEFVIGEQINEEISKDLEPNTVYGDEYYQLLKEEIKLFKHK